MSNFGAPYTAYIVEAVRSAGGKKNGQLSGWHPADLCAAVIDGLVEKTGCDGKHVDDVIVGCVGSIGCQAANIGRTIVMSTKTLPETVPGTTVNRACGSGQQAFDFAAQAVMSGMQDVVIAAGVENMSVNPIPASVAPSFKAGHGQPNGEVIVEKYGEAMKTFAQFGMSTRNMSQFGGAELLARKYKMTREELDAFGVLSHQRGAAATKSGRFKDEIIPLPVKKGADEIKKGGFKVGAGGPEMHTEDEGIRVSTYEGLAALKPMYKTGIITAGTSSQVCDGASAVLICNENGLKKLGLQPVAKVKAMAVVGSDPIIMLEGPVAATGVALKKAGLKASDIDLVEVNEAFAPVPIAVAKAHFGDSLEKINVNGGAMALGHPLGATGTKLMATLVHELQKRQGQYGLLTICEGGGTANATIIERVPKSKL